MKRLIMLAILASVMAGCGPEWPFNWKASEQQKQAADLAVKDYVAVGAYVDPAGEQIRSEGQRSAEITQSYVGLPAERPQPLGGRNLAMLDQAALDAARPKPTIGQVGYAVTDQGQQITDATFTLVELVLSVAGSVAGIWGIGKVKGKFDGMRTTVAEKQDEADATWAALRELVAGVDALTPEVKATVKEVMAKAQSTDTARMVAEAKAT